MCTTCLKGCQPSTAAASETSSDFLEVIINSWMFSLLSPSCRCSQAYYMMNTSTALTHLDQCAHAQMRVVPGSLSDPAPGRTLHQIYSHVGDYVGMQANRVAHRWGRGPMATAHRIEACFSTGHQRAAKLDALEGRPWLEQECSKLLKYALPCETAPTQVATFKCIVTIATRYYASRMGYYCQFAAACLSENSILPILEDISPQRLGSIDTESGDLSVIEHLLIASESSASSIPDALAQRYLAGVLELPSFWEERGTIHITVFTKILNRITRVLNDLSLDSDEGKDGLFFITKELIPWPAQYWPRAEPLLPTSSALATCPDINDILPDPAPDILDVLTMVNNDAETPQAYSESDYISLRNIGEALNDSMQDLGFAPTIVYTKVASVRTFRWTSIGSARRWSLSLRKKPQENEPESVKARSWIPEWLRGLLPRQVQASSGVQSSQNTPEPSPYTSPNISPGPYCSDLPDEFDLSAAPIIVSEQNLTAIRKSQEFDLTPDVSGPSAAPIFVSKQEATFICPIPDCGRIYGAAAGLAVEFLPISERLAWAALLRPPGQHCSAAQPAQAKTHLLLPVPGCRSTFGRSLNLKAHIRSHNEEKPFLPFTCEGCNKQFARMDALNRHLRSEGGTECQRTPEANGSMPDFFGTGLMPMQTDGTRVRIVPGATTSRCLRSHWTCRSSAGWAWVTKTDDP
ncbi:hypothetical protein B0H13DRAFT_1928092 [Mycena leptocephala]|nr:hypothetical protein B0H13DRAFT_1928092 [Mycena leptocephala]